MARDKHILNMCCRVYLNSSVNNFFASFIPFIALFNCWVVHFQVHFLTRHYYLVIAFNMLCDMKF